MDRLGFNDLCSHVEPADREGELPKGSLYAIADGLGDDGIAAADDVLQRISRDYYRDDLDTPANLLRVAFVDIGAELYSRNNQKAELSQAVDLTVAIVLNNRLTIANVGRNRVYFIHDGQWQLITHDPSGVTEMLRNGITNLEEAENAAGDSHHFQRLGEDQFPDVELIADIPIISGDVLLLANAEIAQRMEDDNFSVFNHSDDLTSICNELVALTNLESHTVNRILFVLRFSQARSPLAKQQSLPLPLPETPMQKVVQVEGIHQTHKSRKESRIFLRQFPVKMAIVVCGLLGLFVLGWLGWQVIKSRQPLVVLPHVQNTPTPAPTSPQLFPLVTISTALPTFSKPASVPSRTASVHTATLTSQETPLSTVTPLPGGTSTAEITPTFLVAETGFVCVWEVQQGNSLFSTIRRFNLPYQADETYKYYSECSKEEGACNGESKMIESPSRIEIGWFIIVPVESSDACQAGQGAWLKGKVETP